MSKYREFKAKYDKIQSLSKIEDPEPWLEYPSLIVEMLEVIRYQQEALIWFEKVTGESYYEDEQ